MRKRAFEHVNSDNSVRNLLPLLHSERPKLLSFGRSECNRVKVLYHIKTNSNDFDKKAG